MSAIIRNNVRVFGEGSRLIIFAHSFGCDQSMWRLVSPLLSKDFSVMLFDFVGAGNSDLRAWTPVRYQNLEGYALDILEIMVELDLRKAILVGHSVSAMIGILAARAAPHLFSHLVLINPSPRYINDGAYFGGTTASQIEEILRLLDNDHTGWNTVIVPRLMGVPDHQELDEELIKSFCNTEPRIARHFARVILTTDNRADLSYVKTPTLILQCRGNIIVPEEVGTYVHRAMPNSELLTLSATGHYPNLTAPEETAMAILRFLTT